MSVVILVFFALPSVFGFQNFVQWGAMYDDRWCTVVQYENNPHADPYVRSESLVPSADARRVYSGPTHNKKTCLAQARMYCGRQTKDRWLVRWVEPQFQGIRFMGDVNVCDGTKSLHDYWFY